MNYRIETLREIRHGVVFLYDPSMLIDVPPDTGAGPVLFTANCISLWTTHEVDGPTSLVLTDRNADEDCNLVLQTTIETKGRRLAFNSSECDPIIEVGVLHSSTAVTIYANDSLYPSKLICVVAAEQGG